MMDEDDLVIVFSPEDADALYHDLRRVSTYGRPELYTLKRILTRYLGKHVRPS